MDTSIEDAARDLGAGPFTTFTRVTLPLLWPALLAAGLLAFAMSIDDYVITSFVAGSTVTFPLFVYGAAKVGLPPQVLCFGTIIFFVGLGPGLANGVLNRRHLRPGPPPKTTSPTQLPPEKRRVLGRLTGEGVDDLHLDVDRLGASLHGHLVRRRRTRELAEGEHNSG